MNENMNRNRRNPGNASYERARRSGNGRSSQTYVYGSAARQPEPVRRRQAAPGERAEYVRRQEAGSVRRRQAASGGRAEYVRRREAGPVRRRQAASGGRAEYVRRQEAGPVRRGQTAPAKRPEYVRRQEAEPVRRRQAVPAEQMEPLVRKNRDKARYMNAGYLLFLAVAVCAATLILVNYVQLQAELTNRTRSVAAKQSELNSRRIANDEEYNRIINSVNLEEIKRIAIGELGMIYAQEGQIILYTNEDSDYMRPVLEDN